MKRQNLLCATITIVVTLAFLFHPLFGATLEPHLFSQNAALPSAYITALATDHDGRILIGTIRGLARYDGYEIQTFTVRNGLASNEISALLVDSRNRIWVGHSNGKLTLWHNNAFQIIPLSNAPNAPIVSLYEDSHNQIWIGTLGNGVFILGEQISHLTSKNGLPGNAVFAVLEDSRQRIWIGTENGLAIIPSVSALSTPTQWEYLDRSRGLPDNWVRCLAEDNQGRIWIGTRNGGIASYSEARKLRGKSPWQYFSRKQGYRIASFITRLLIDPSGTLWIGTYGGGVAQIRNGKYLHRYGKNEGIPNLDVLALTQDREGQIWVGTFGGGIVLFRPAIITRYTAKNRLPSNNVLAVIDDHQQFLWIATDNGLAQIRYPTLPGRPLDITVYSPKDTTADLITVLLQDSSKQCWGISARGKIYSLRRSGIQIRFRAAITQLQAAAIDTLGNFWLLDRTNKLLVYSPSGQLQRWHTIPESDGAVRGLSLDPYYGTLILTDKALLQLHDDQFRRFPFNLTTLYPTVLAVDPTHTIWIGTNGQGILQISPENQLRRMESAPRFVSDVITALFVDLHSQNLWIGTNQGFARFSFANRQFYPYGPNEGFPAIEINTGAISRDRYGNIWMGSVDGAYSYRLTEAESQTFIPDIVIKRVKIMALDSAVSSGSTIPYDYNYLLFEYAGISLHNPKAIRYSYMLAGFDTAWSAPTAKRSVLYSQLPPGTYIFKVRAGYLYGQWSKHPATFEFTIAPPWWQTHWFYLGIALLLTLLTSGILWYRNYRVAQLNQWLEKEVARRTAALVAKTQELELVIQELEQAKQRAEAANEAKMNFLAKVTHELRTPLNIILGFTRRLLRKHQITSPDALKALDAIYRNAETLLAHINSILQYARMETQKTESLITKVDLSNLLSRLVEEFRPILHKGVQLQLQIHSQDLTVYGNAQMIDQILKNLLSNAIRFTEQGSITIRVSTITDHSLPYLAIDVQDTGRGIAKDDQPSIFEPFHQGKTADSTSIFGGIGLGLAIAKQFAMEMQGDLRLLYSELGKGSTFRLLLPQKLIWKEKILQTSKKIEKVENVA